jgi:hypothetical protein
LSRPAVPPSPLSDRVGYSDHVRFRGYVPVYCRSLQPPCLRFATAVTGRHARLGSRLLARLYRGRHHRRQTSTHLQGATLIKPDVPISGIRLSDWLHREVHGEQTNRTRLRHGEQLSFAPRHSNLRRRLSFDGSPPITRTTFPTCRAHYPGGSRGCACRLLPHARGLPQMTGGSASALELSRPARASLRHGPSDRSAAQGRLCRRAPTQPITRPCRLPASGPIDNYPGETLPH